MNELYQSISLECRKAFPAYLGQQEALAAARSEKPLDC